MVIFAKRGNGSALSATGLSRSVAPSKGARGGSGCGRRYLVSDAIARNPAPIVNIALSVDVIRGHGQYRREYYCE